ncbi:unnamed protein product, partial [Plutella xylostella]
QELSSITCESYPGGSEIIRESLKHRGVPPESLDIVLASFAKNTISQYNSSLKAWWNFCIRNRINVYESSPTNVLIFLTEIFNSGCGYSSLNTYRSALSIILGKKVTTDDCITRFLKGTYRLRPPRPKYDFTWDPLNVLNYLSSFFPYNNVSVADLAIKTVTLIALASAQRMQTLSLIKLKNIQFQQNSILIKIPDLIKTSRPGTCQPLLNLPYIRESPQICPALSVKSYIDKTKTLRGEQSDDHLFISVRKPYKKVGSQTLGHWVKKALEASGIDVGIFGAHSTRHASTSAAHSAGVNIEVVRKAAGWSDSSNVFLKYYKKDLLRPDANYVEAVFNI